MNEMKGVTMFQWSKNLPNSYLRGRDFVASFEYENSNFAQLKGS